MVLEPIFDYSRLRGKIREVFGTQDKYAEALQLSRVSVSQRLNNLLEFSQEEMYRSADLLGFHYSEIPNYFFVTKAQKQELTYKTEGT